jgi:sulfhydrogenase subunit beta (sulfur reductase)
MSVAFSKENLQVLLDTLVAEEYEVVGPRLREGAIVYAPLRKTEELPRGWIEKQDAATYRMQKDDENRYFGYTVGPHSWKKYLHPPDLCMFKARKEGKSFQVDDKDEVKKRAFLGVRGCEMAAIAVQDNVFLGQEFRDPWYQRRRDAVFIVGVNCSRAASTCFCVSMDTGPTLKKGGDDLTLTELKDAFLAEAHTEQGKAVLSKMPTREATAEELEEATGQAKTTAAQMGRKLETKGLPELLKQNMDHARWDEVADRCLTCSNCTMVCPTCFCFTVDEVTDLTGQESERVRRWDSCFSTEFTYTSGSSHRVSSKSRYRHWMTHKLATWHDQFDESGCVGCGRCITWCPVGIDITEEAAAIREGVEDV